VIRTLFEHQFRNGHGHSAVENVSSIATIPVFADGLDTDLVVAARHQQGGQNLKAGRARRQVDRQCLFGAMVVSPGS
jgi:hypothetical protein